MAFRSIVGCVLLGGCSVISSTDDSRLDDYVGSDAGDAATDTGGDDDDDDVDGSTPDGTVPDSGECGDCDDGDPCTTDRCNAARCEHVAIDADDDGASPLKIGDVECSTGTDCDDGDALVRPGATEICNAIDDNCNGASDEGCEEAPGDTCAETAVLTLTAGRATATGRFADYGDDLFTICPRTGEMRVSSGPDVVFFVPVEATSDIVIDTIGSDADTILAVATECDDASTAFRIGCNHDIDTTTDASRMYVRSFNPGTQGPGVFVLVDAADEDERGAFTLNVQVTPSAADACESPYEIGGGSVVGFITLGASTSGECQRLSESFESETVFVFSPPADGRAQFRVFSNDFVPDAYVRTACGGEDMRCDSGNTVSSGPFAARADLDVMTRDMGDHLLFVDGASPGFGEQSYLLIYDP